MPPSVNHSLLETVESAFQALSAGPDPLTLDGAILGQGLPPGPVTLNDVRSLLLSRPQPEVLDAVWKALAVRVRQETDRETWLVAAIGVMLPGLRGISQRQGWGSWMDREDLDSEAVAGLLAELSSCCRSDLERCRSNGSLDWVVAGRVAHTEGAS
jgi:hypothetical protein